MIEEKAIRISLDGMYLYRVTPLFKQVGLFFYRVKEPRKTATVSDIYFFNESYTGWASLKINSNFIPGSGRSFTPKWRTGEMSFLRELQKNNITAIVIMEFKTGIYYSENIKKSYVSKDLLPFNFESLFL